MSRVWKLGARIAFQMSTFRRGQLFCLYSISMEPLVMKRASVAHRFENDVVILRCRWWRITSFAYEKKDDVDTRPSFRRQMKCMMTMMTENVELVSLLSIQIMICHLQLFFFFEERKRKRDPFFKFCCSIRMSPTAAVCLRRDKSHANNNNNEECKKWGRPFVG